jgi:plastocyanin
MTGRVLFRRAPILVALLALPIAGCSGEAGPPAGCTDPVPADTVRLEDFAFEPSCLQAAPGATIRLENVGETPHTFTVTETDVSFDVKAGESAEGSLSGVEPGRYAVTCTYHPQMTATLTVEGQ